MSICLYLSEKNSIHLYRSNENPNSHSCVVIFSSYGGRLLGTQIAGTSTLLKAGYDVVCVQSNCDDWHQSIPVDTLKHASIYISERYKHKYGYGSSMGGYGALVFASIFNFDKVLALSPQFSLSIPGEKRWPDVSGKINWRYRIEHNSKFEGVVMVIFDKYDFDAVHADKIKDAFKSTDVLLLPIPFGSHPVTHWLNDVGVLKATLLSFLRDIPLQWKYSDLKKESATYYEQLSIFCLKRGRLDLCYIFTSKAIEKGRQSHSNYRRLSNVYSKKKLLGQAIKYGEKSLSLAPNKKFQIKHTVHLINLLLDQGDIKKAKDYYDVVKDVEFINDNFNRKSLKIISSW